MDKHLNLFRFFCEDDGAEIREKNMSRALALTLSHDPLFFDGFMHRVFGSDYDDFFTGKIDRTDILIDLEKETRSLNAEYRQVIAIALTDNEKIAPINQSSFRSRKVVKTKQNFTDVVISIKDVLIIIEVKRDQTDCLTQLRYQAEPFYADKKNKPSVHAMHLGWQQIYSLAETNAAKASLFGTSTPFCKSLLELIEERYPQWVPTKPFHQLALSKGDFNREGLNDAKKLILEKRLVLAMNETGYKLDEFPDRTAFKIKKDWASEIIPSFGLNDKNEPVVYITIWPGDTKAQGYSLYKEPLAWTQKKNITIKGEVFPLWVEPEVKFSHFQRFIGKILLDDPANQLRNPKDPIHDRKNFDNSGKWTKPEWKELERFLDGKLKFDWRTPSRWVSEFKNSDRKYVCISFGFEVSIEIPYKRFQEIDRNEGDYKKVGKELKFFTKALENLIKN